MRAAAGLSEKLGRWDMASEEREPVTIESLLKSGAILGHKDGNYGSQYPRVAEFGSEGVPFLTAKSLNDGRIDIEGAPRLSEQRANDLRFGFVQSGDVLLSHNATVGRVAVVPNFKGKLLIGTSLTYFRVDSSRILPRYLAAFFTGSDFQAQLNAVMSQSTRNQVPITAQRKLRIVLPSLVDQATIADILGALDDKIALIREANETQKAIARTIFKSWFVDFDPVRAKAEGREPEGLDAATAALFPSEFEDSDAGLIPQGWTTRGIDTIAEFLNGIALQKYPAMEREEWLPAIKIAQLKRGSVDGADRISPSIPEKYIVQDGDLLFSWSGSLEVEFWTGGKGALNQHLFKVSSEQFPHWFVYLWLRFHLDGFREIAESKVTTMGHIQRHHLSEATVVIPPRETLRGLSGFAAPLIEKVVAGRLQARTLTALRDTLLPHLISGKPRVPEAEAMLTEV
jgi:type I restriction enzyme S subunit